MSEPDIEAATEILALRLAVIEAARAHVLSMERAGVRHWVTLAKIAQALAAYDAAMEREERIDAEPQSITGGAA